MHHFLYDPETRRAIRKDAEAAASFPFPGVFLWENFISEEEEKQLITMMDQDVWNESQSGRRKQVHECHQHTSGQIMSHFTLYLAFLGAWGQKSHSFTSSFFIKTPSSLHVKLDSSVIC